jgi:hypothetical protein
MECDKISRTFAYDYLNNFYVPSCDEYSELFADYLGLPSPLAGVWVWAPRSAHHEPTFGVVLGVELAHGRLVLGVTRSARYCTGATTVSGSARSTRARV